MVPGLFLGEVGREVTGKGSVGGVSREKDQVMGKSQRVLGWKFNQENNGWSSRQQREPREGSLN